MYLINELFFEDAPQSTSSGDNWAPGAAFKLK